MGDTAQELVSICMPSSPPQAAAPTPSSVPARPFMISLRDCATASSCFHCGLAASTATERHPSASVRRCYGEDWISTARQYTGYTGTNSDVAADFGPPSEAAFDAPSSGHNAVMRASAAAFRLTHHHHRHLRGREMTVQLRLDQTMLHFVAWYVMA